MTEETRGSVREVSDEDVQWDIPNFHTLPREDNYSVSSPPFSWNNFTWSFRLFPNGILPGNDRSMIMALEKPRDPQPEGERASLVSSWQFKLCMLGRKGNKFRMTGDNLIFIDRYNLCAGRLMSVDRARAEMEASGPNSQVSFCCKIQHFITYESSAESSEA